MSARVAYSQRAEMFMFARVGVVLGTFGVNPDRIGNYWVRVGRLSNCLNSWVRWLHFA